MTSRPPYCTEGDAEAQGRAENCPSHKVRQGRSWGACPGLAELLAPLGAAGTKWKEEQVTEVTAAICPAPATLWPRLRASTAALGEFLKMPMKEGLWHG